MSVEKGANAVARADAMRVAIGACLVVGVALAIAWPAGKPPHYSPRSMAKVGRISERFQSYNIEMAEVTGGRFWKPYASRNTSDPVRAATKAGLPGGVDPSRYEYRPPVDLGDARLRKLAAALGPAYVRVSGTWANSTYFSDSDAVAGAPPPGYIGVLTRPQWRGVGAFTRAVDGALVTSFAVSSGARDAAGAWRPDRAQRLVNYTRALGGHIAAAEFMNEPDLVDLANAPKGYNAEDYGRDFTLFRHWMRTVSPETVVAGPGSIAETGITPWLMWLTGTHMISSADMLAASQAKVDVFSYHHYGAMSERCIKSGIGSTDLASVLSAGWLGSVDGATSSYQALRDEYAPAAPLWLTETGEAACGGNPWASTFADTFRYLDQLGRLARRGVQVVMHNTLAASDYGLLDETDHRPRPNYWAALLWHEFMGTTVLDAGAAPSGSVHLYAHCLRGVPGGVALLAINLDRNASRPLDIDAAAEGFTLAAPALDSREVRLNGHVLLLGPDDVLPRFRGRPVAAGAAVLPAASITFLTIPRADNAACR
jgi:hypothetical protein